MFKLEIETRNAAFSNPNAEFHDLAAHANASRAEVARILRRWADKIADGYTEGDIMDINGNRVGTFTLTED